LVAAAALALVAGLAVAAALGAFSSDGKRKAPLAHSTTPAPPAGPPAAGASLDTVRCSETACSQRGIRVVPPIEGARCAPSGRAGRWVRIDADSQSPLFACQPDGSPPAGAARRATVPDLGGARLDHAETFLDRLGVKHDTSGGGAFGIIDSGNWTVCTTAPDNSAPLSPDGSVKLFVDRSC
jgi:hypothetical protein